MTTISPKATVECNPAFTVRQLAIRQLPPAGLTPVGRRARTHSLQQIQKIADSIEAFGFSVPVIVDEQNKVIAGNARVEAANLLGLEFVPVVTLSHLDAAQKRAFVLAENKIAEESGWDKEALALEFSELLEIDLSFDIALSGFFESEIDAIIFDDAEGREVCESSPPEPPPTPGTRVGDLWLLGEHRLICGDPTSATTVSTLLNGVQARAVLADPFVCVELSNHAAKRKSSKKAGLTLVDMNAEQPSDTLASTLQKVRESLSPNGLAYFCIDYLHLRDALQAAIDSRLTLIDIIVWDKHDAIAGSVYRARHELILLFAGEKSLDSSPVKLDHDRRDRSNVWQYRPSADPGNLERRFSKPISMVRDAILDCTKRGDLILDLCFGSRATLIAAEESGRRAAAVGLDPKDIDAAIMGWQQFTGKEARLAGSNLTWGETHARRCAMTSTVPVEPNDAAKTVACAPRARVRLRPAA